MQMETVREGPVEETCIYFLFQENPSLEVRAMSFKLFSTRPCCAFAARLETREVTGKIFVRGPTHRVMVSKTFRASKFFELKLNFSRLLYFRIGISDFFCSY